MPLPLAHSAIGLAAHALSGDNQSIQNPWKRLVFVIVLANLPDVDLLFGLIFYGNGCVFHRGPTHSLLFALMMGWLAAKAWRYWSNDGALGFLSCVLLILSHVFADAVFTISPVSFMWPLEVHWSPGYYGWLDVMESLCFETWSDLGLILGAGAVIVVSRVFRYRVFPHLDPEPARVVSASRPKGSRPTP